MPARTPTFDPSQINFGPNTDFSQPKYMIDRVDVYRVRLEDTYLTNEDLGIICTRDLENNGILNVPQPGVLTMIFPTGTVVTPVMIHLLRNWGSTDEVSFEENRLARLIVFIEQAVVIRPPIA